MQPKITTVEWGNKGGVSFICKDEDKAWRATSIDVPFGYLDKLIEAAIAVRDSRSWRARPSNTYAGAWVVYKEGDPCYVPFRLGTSEENKQDAEEYAEKINKRNGLI